MSKQYTKEDCIESLEKAKEILGESPTILEYQELDLSPSHNVFIYRFDTWNNAKAAAGLEEYSVGQDFSEIPSIVDVSQDEWESLRATRRHKIRRYAKLWRIKSEVGCQECGYDENPVALDFHHRSRGSKEFNITQAFINGKRNWEETKDEIKKCDVLCANCHRVEETDTAFL